MMGAFVLLWLVTAALLVIAFYTAARLNAPLWVRLVLFVCAGGLAAPMVSMVME